MLAATDAGRQETEVALNSPKEVWPSDTDFDSGLQKYKRINPLFLSHQVAVIFYGSLRKPIQEARGYGQLVLNVYSCEGVGSSEGWPFDLNPARQIRFPLAGKELKGLLGKKESGMCESMEMRRFSVLGESSYWTTNGPVQLETATGRDVMGEENWGWDGPSWWTGRNRKSQEIWVLISSNVGQCR